MRNGKSVVVKVIDRGPFGRGRIIDISWAAAKAIGMIAQGVATVKVERMDNPIPYRPDDDKLPRIDFEMAESDFKDFPKWKKQKEEQKNKGTAAKEESKIKKENHNGKPDGHDKQDTHGKQESHGKSENFVKQETHGKQEVSNRKNSEAEGKKKSIIENTKDNNNKAKNHH